MLAFRHQLVREALDADTTAARRAYIHREAARVLHDRPRHDPMEVAWHAQRGGDSEAAASRVRRGGGDCHSIVMMSPRRRSCSIAPSRCNDTPTARLARAAGTHREVGQRPAPKPTPAALSNKAADAEALEVAAWVEYYRRDYQLAFSYAEEAFDRSTDDGAPSQLPGDDRAFPARPKATLGQADERLTAAVASAPPSVRGFARVWLSGLRMHQGRLDEAHELVEQALVEGAWLGHPFARHHGASCSGRSPSDSGAAFAEAFAATDVARDGGRCRPASSVSASRRRRTT